MSHSTPLPRPLHIAALLFPGFQFLDLAGPLDILNLLSLSTPLKLSLLAATLSPVTTLTPAQAAQGSSFCQHLVPTATFDAGPAYADLDVVLVPGGGGTGDDEGMRGVVEWLGGWVKELEREKGKGKGNGQTERKKWLITVCTGSEVLARTGVLDGRRATTNKRSFNLIKAKHPAVNWVPKARWVVDGDIWTSSGISAGIDVTFAWVAEVYGEDVAKQISDRSEYERNLDADRDRFAEVWGAV